jgi:hypothetical protein
MDEMTELRGLRADAPPPDRTQLLPGRQKLLHSAGRRQRLRGAARRPLTVVGAAAAAILAVLTTAQLPGGGDGTAAPPASRGGDASRSEEARSVLRKAARAAAARPDPEPRTGQWVYVKFLEGLADSPGDYPPSAAEETENWWRFEALENGWREQGSLSPREAYTVLDELPAEPEKVFAEALKWHPPTDTDDMGEARFDAAEYLLLMPLAPSEGRAKVYRALAELEGVRVVDHLVTGPTGDKAIALYYDDDDALRDEILIDPQTHRLAGFRTVQVEDPEPFLTHPELDQYEAGDVVTNDVVLDVALVDRDGRRP